MEKPSRFTDLRNARNHIIHSIQKYDPLSVINFCIALLNRTDVTTPERMRLYQPWFLLILIKWTFLHGQLWELRGTRKITELEFNELVNELNDLPSYARLPSEHQHLLLFLRKMASQQFWIQEQFVFSRFARQSMFFGTLSENHTLSSQFQSMVGLKISEFIELSLMLMARFVWGNQTVVSLEWFAPAIQKYGAERVDRFLTTLSLTPSEVRQFLRSQEKYSDPQLEIFEQSPLKSYPLLNVSSSYFTYSHHLLLSALQDFIHDKLKTADSNNFMTPFGKLFEKYLNDAIAYAGWKFATETVIKRVLGETSKTVDFIVTDDDITLLIDAKAVELSYLGMTGDDPAILWNKLENSVARGIVQGFETTSHLLEGQNIGEIIVKKKEIFLLIVTFKDLYIGNGIDFYTAVGAPKLEDLIMNNYSGIAPILFENIYFISIDDFDFLIEYSRNSPGKLAALLKWAVEQDKRSSEKKFVFRQHIRTHSPSDPKLPSYLDQEMASLIERIGQRIE